ncbi:hypothetical protein T484DRAFT_1859831, partial [Baffinella frigidus]
GGGGYGREASPPRAGVVPTPAQAQASPPRAGVVPTPAKAQVGSERGYMTSDPRREAALAAYASTTGPSAPSREMPYSQVRALEELVIDH